MKNHNGVFVEKILLLWISLFSTVFVFSQEKAPVTFGKIAVADFELPQSPVIDSSTNAIIIADVGSTYFVGNRKGWFSYVFKRNTRIKILKKNGLDAATVKENLYETKDDKEELSDVSATTYNLENGAITQAKLGKNEIFTDKLDKKHIEKKFTLPAVKEGSIIEFSYTIKSDFEFNMRPWSFQHIHYPSLWSEYDADIPNLLTYALIKQGVHPYYINKTDGGFQQFKVTEAMEDSYNNERELAVRAYVNRFRWVMKDVPAFSVENYMYAPMNYTDRIEFQLAKTYNGEETADIVNTWDKMTANLLNSTNFGNPLAADNSWLNQKLDDLTRGQRDLLEQARNIYYFIKDNFTCNNFYNPFIQTTLEDVFRKHSGSVGDINLLLTAMLRQKHITACPVIMSTREHGFNSPRYPVYERLNYVICKVNIGDEIFYLDASHPMLGFGRLPENCYNGYARVISSEDSLHYILFSPDALKQDKLTTVFIVNDVKNKGMMSGVVNTNPAYLESCRIRSRISSSNEKDFFKQVQQTYGPDFKIENAAIDSLGKLELPVKLHYGFSFNPGNGEDIIYYKPIITEEYKDNPFKAAERQYPVEMPYPLDDLYVLDMEVPAGYQVDELPKSVKVALNGSDGYFEYLIENSGDHVQLRCHIKLNKATFIADDYNGLRDFFGYVAKKQSEQIVFKKKK